MESQSLLEPMASRSQCPRLVLTLSICFLTSCRRKSRRRRQRTTTLPTCFYEKFHFLLMKVVSEWRSEGNALSTAVNYRGENVASLLVTSQTLRISENCYLDHKKRNSGFELTSFPVHDNYLNFFIISVINLQSNMCFQDTEGCSVYRNGHCPVINAYSKMLLHFYANFCFS